MHVRELPPLRLHDEIETPSGRRYRWGPDEHDPADVPSGRRFGDTMPGGFESADVTLARKPGVAYGDLERLSTWRILGPGGDVAWEGRLERAPLVSGDRMAISPSAVGWQAHLDDDKSASFIGVDRELSRWGEAARGRKLGLLSISRDFQSGSIVPDPTSGVPSAEVALVGAWARVSHSEVWYDAGPGNKIARLKADYLVNDQINFADGNWSLEAVLATDDAAASFNGTGDIGSGSTGSADVSATTTDRRFAAFVMLYAAGAGNDGTSYQAWWSNVRVIGDHGLTIRGGTAASEGLWASDVVAYAVGRWAPHLVIAGDSVDDSTFVVPHLAFHNATTVGEIIRQANRFELRDWWVGPGRVFYLKGRGTHGRRWRAWVGPSQLEETGPQVERLWESVIVQYQDVDGSTRTVGPPNSGADTESANLKDDDPENPANKLGIKRRDLLVMGTGTAGSATEVGRRFLEESKLLDSSGRARFVGHVMDDRGVLHPYWRPRAGDYVSFVNAADTSYRRIVRTDKDEATHSCAVDLDSPPEGLAALLERLGVVLVPLGL